MSGKVFDFAGWNDAFSRFDFIRQRIAPVFLSILSFELAHTLTGEGEAVRKAYWFSKKIRNSLDFFRNTDLEHKLKNWKIITHLKSALDLL